ncbi:MAG: proteasome assembly chaperone family protein [Acidimicrobiales bacterium]
MKIAALRHTMPKLEAPVLIVCLDGWVDAGQVLDRTLRAILSGPSVVLASFDPDDLINYRARRPIMRVESGINTGLDWPRVDLLMCRDLDGRDVVVLAGREPDRAWRGFSDEVVAIAQEIGVRLTLTLGGYPAATPHTRDVTLSAVGTTPKLVERVGFLEGKLDVPAGVHAALERACAGAGIPSVGLWAPVPHYAAAEPFPAAAVALLKGLELVADRRFLTDEIKAEAAAVNDRLDTQTTNDDEQARMVGNLESHADKVARTHPSDIPTGDQLAAEFSQFLEDNGD